MRKLPEPGSREAQALADARLRDVNDQLDQINEPVLSSEAREMIRRAAAAYALWLELDSDLDEMGLSVEFGGGLEWPEGWPDGVAVVEIHGIRIGGISART